MKKKWGKIMFGAVVFLCGCSTQSNEKDKDDSWIYNEVEKYNTEDVRQIEILETKETQRGEMKRKQVIITDKSKALVYIEGKQVGPGDIKEKYVNYLGIKDSKPFNIYKYGDEENYIETNEISSDSINEHLDGRKLEFSENTKIKSVGEEKVKGKSLIKVEVQDSGFDRKKQQELYQTVVKQVQEAEKKQLEKEYNKYMGMKRKNWTLWFDKNEKKLTRVEFDNSQEEAFVLYLLYCQDPTSDVLNQRPIKAETVWEIKMGSECDDIELPTIRQ